VQPFAAIVRRSEFKKDMKSLKKRFATLEDDLATLLKTSVLLFHRHGIDNGGIENEDRDRILGQYGA
jgi:hypothetical protein